MTDFGADAKEGKEMDLIHFSKKQDFQASTQISWEAKFLLTVLNKHVLFAFVCAKPWTL